MKGPLRIRKLFVDERGVSGGDEYLARLVKLIPAEVVAVYLCGMQLAKSWPGIWAFVCLILVFVARTLGTKESGKSVQWIAVVVSLGSFIIWVYATGGHFFELKLSPETGIPSIAVLIWTFLVPYIYKGDSAPTGSA